MKPIIPEPVAVVISSAAAIMLASVAVLPLLKVAAETWARAKGDKFGRYVFLAAVAVATMYAGAKRIGSISYPYIDPEIRYLTDNGSYVTNDAVHVAFTRMIAPSSASLLIDYRRIDLTNETDWVRHTTTTFAKFANPSDIQFPAATNYNWIVYTMWTPGPTVKTNGVWHAYWGLDKRSRTHLIPIRTCVRTNAVVIATPKSKWDWEATTNRNTEATNENE